jgi:diacylglycerol kinase (ATP)
MKKAALLYNPRSGNRHNRRVAEVEAAAAVLQNAGIEVAITPSRSATDAGEQARQAALQGYDTVFACGGDGTIHDVVQGLVGTPAALGIIPQGTANALAHDVGLPLSPASAARAALTAKPKRIAVGRVSFQDLSGNPAARYFTVTLGVGMDAYLFHRLDPSLKIRFGMLSYYLHAKWLWLTHPMPSFDVEFAEENGTKRQASVSELLAVRIRNFGGVLRELAPGASLDRNDLRLVLFHTRSRLRYLGYIMRGLAGARWKLRGIELVHSSHVACKPLPLPHAARVYVEADGEILGTLPAEVTIVPDALTILTPQG